MWLEEGHTFLHHSFLSLPLCFRISRTLRYQQAIVLVFSNSRPDVWHWGRQESDTQVRPIMSGPSTYGVYYSVASGGRASTLSAILMRSSGTFMDRNSWAHPARTDALCIRGGVARFGIRKIACRKMPTGKMTQGIYRGKPIIQENGANGSRGSDSMIRGADFSRRKSSTVSQLRWERIGKIAHNQ